MVSIRFLMERRTRRLVIVATLGMLHWLFGNLYEEVVIAPNWIVDTPRQLQRLHEVFVRTSPTTYFVPMSFLAPPAVWVAHAVQRGSLARAELRLASLFAMLASAVNALHAVAEIWGSGARFGFAGIGHGETYWFAVLDAPPGEKDDHPLETVKRHFARFPPPVPALLAATPPDQVLRTDIHDRLPVSTWTSGRVTLLGDAAHPTTPNLGLGGCMAIEDAVVLAYALSHATSSMEALAVYENERVSRTTHDSAEEQ
jgi:hypothetical protein